LVMTDAVVDWGWAERGLGLEPCVETAIGVCRSRARWDAGCCSRRGRRRAAAAIGPASWPLAACARSVEGLMKALDFAAGLGVVGRGMFDLDPQALQLQLQEHLAAARLGGEDGGVVAEQGGGQSELVGRPMEGRGPRRRP